jgi:hypothetical protein
MIAFSTFLFFLDEFGWRDRGVFQCYVENGFGNATERVDVKLNYHYRCGRLID